MFTVYLIVLTACTLALLALIARRAALVYRQGRVNRGRLLNEWLWTVVPLMVLLGLLWQALRRA